MKKKRTLKQHPLHWANWWIQRGKRKKTSMEKTMEVAVKQFSETSKEDFERYIPVTYEYGIYAYPSVNFVLLFLLCCRYKKLEEQRVEKEHQFYLEQAKLENERRKRART